MTIKSRVMFTVESGGLADGLGVLVVINTTIIIAMNLSTIMWVLDFGGQGSRVEARGED